MIFFCMNGAKGKGEGIGYPIKQIFFMRKRRFVGDIVWKIFFFTVIFDGLINNNYSI
jgi:hypothetical protein